MGLTISDTDGKKVDLEDYFKLEEGYVIQNTSRTFKFDKHLFDFVKREGWHMIPDKGELLGLYLKRRPPKGHPKDIRKVPASP